MTNINELLDRLCACLGPDPGETECRCIVRRKRQIETVALAAGISQKQAKLAIAAHERNLRAEFGGPRHLKAQVKPRTGKTGKHSHMDTKPPLGPRRKSGRS